MLSISIDIKSNYCAIFVFVQNFLSLTMRPIEKFNLIHGDLCTVIDVPKKNGRKIT